MDPNEAYTRALQIANAGDLQGAINILDPVIEEFREFGPAYTLHAKVFLMAGDCAQPMIDLDAAEWATQEYGNENQQLEVHEVRAVAYAVRSIYGGQTEAGKCREEIELLIRKRATPRSWWFLPAACFELAHKEQSAREWVEKLSKYEVFKSASGFYFTKRAGLTQLLAMPKTPEEMIPVHYARSYRARREGDKKAAEKYRKRMHELLEPDDLWNVVNLYASRTVVVAAV